MLSSRNKGQKEVSEFQAQTEQIRVTSKRNQGTDVAESIYGNEEGSEWVWL